MEIRRQSHPCVTLKSHLAFLSRSCHKWPHFPFSCPEKGVCMLINTSPSSTFVSSSNSHQFLAHSDNAGILNPYLILILEDYFQLF